MKLFTLILAIISLTLIVIMTGCGERQNKSLEVEESMEEIISQNYVYYPIKDDNVKDLFEKAENWIINNKNKTVLSIQIINATYKYWEMYEPAVTAPSGIVIFYK